MLNKYPSDCADCGEFVPAECGTVHNVDGEWRTQCDDCNEQTERVIAIECYEAIPVVKPKDFLGKDLFESYRQACEDAGSRFSKPAGGNLISWRAVPRVAKELKSRGFAVEIGPDVAARMQAFSDRATNQVADADDRLDDLDIELEKRGHALFGFQREGVRWLAPLPAALLGDDMGLGKLQPTDTKVLTPSGWKMIGSLSVGDFVIGSDGMSTKVTGVFPQGIKPSYRITFSDHSSVQAGSEHLWTVRYRRGGKRWTDLTLTTDELRLRPCKGTLDLNKTTLYLPIMSSPATFKMQTKLPINAYLLGQLIANGSLAHGTPALSCHSADWPFIKKILEQNEVLIGSVKQYDNVVRALFPGIVGTIRDLELDVLSRDKRIPRIALLGSESDRVDLFIGLMDGDGSCSKEQSRLVYHTISPQLAKDVQELVECLGGIASIREYDRSKDCKPTEYRVRVRPPSSIAPFAVPRKRDRYHPGNRARPCRTVTSVEYVRDVESVCIVVAAYNNLYATEHAILTHNTVQAYAALPKDAPVLVVCPAIAKGVWLREQPKWSPDHRVTVLSGRSSFRWPEPGEVVVTNFEILPNIVGDESDAKLRKHLKASCGTETVLICDEAQALKNWKTARSKRFKSLSKIVRSFDGKVWLLTATPLENRPGELWGVLSAAGLDIEAFSNWETFVMLCGGEAQKFGGFKWGKPSRELKRRLHRVMLRRTKKEVMPDLPTKLHTDHIVEIGKRSEAAKLSTEFCRMLADAGIDLQSATRIAIMAGIREIGFDEISRARAALATAKIPEMIKLVEQYEDAEEPLVVFSAHRAPVDALAEREGWGVITGDTPPTKRTQLEDAFQAGELSGLAATIRAGGTAITLTRGNQMIFVDQEWTPALNAQAEDRQCRIGQTRGVQIIRLIANHPLDQSVAELLDTKQAIIDGIIGGANRVEVAPITGDLAIAAQKIVAATEPPEPPPEPAYQNGGNGRRNAKTPKEQWAERAMTVLAERGQFGSVDRVFGILISEELATGRGLTDDQWRAALAVGKKYWGLLGPTP